MKTSLMISLFHSVTSHRPARVSVEQVVDILRSGRCKQLVEEVRRLYALTHREAGDKRKRLLPFVTFSGIFEGGHGAVNLRTYSGMVVLDYDKIYDPARLAEMRTRCTRHPSVVAAFITPSGAGVKVVVLTTGSAGQHAETYRQVVSVFDPLMEWKHDASCKDISRGHFLSWDPQAFYRADAVPFEVAEPAGGSLAQIADTPLCGPLAATDAWAGRDRPVAAPASSPFSAVHAADEFIRAWQVLHPAREGERNNTLFRLACEARRRGIPQADLCREAQTQLAGPGFTGREIAAVVKSAYSRADLEESHGIPLFGHEKDKRTLRAENVQTESEAEELTEEIPHGEILRAQTPTFPEAIYNDLPALLQDGLRYTEDARERDMLLLGMITAVSALLPRVSGYYAGKPYAPNLYTFVVAGAASNKSVLEYGLSLCQVHFDEVMRQNEQLRQQYEADLEAWKQAGKQTGRTGKLLQDPQTGAVLSLAEGGSGQACVARPREPRYFYPHIPADISKSKLLEHLRDNGERGGLLFDTEADTLSGAGRQDYGNFFDYLRKFFHHEATSCSFKINGRPFYLRYPRLSVLLSGTPSQLGRMIPTSENGLYSRFLFYTYRQEPRWKDVSPRGGEEDRVEKHFQGLSHRLSEVIRWLEESPTQVSLSDSQWMRLNEVFAALLQESTLLEREDFLSCVKRHGLMTVRLCMVFTALDKVERGDRAKEALCSESHFEAALSLVTTCLEHSRLLITSVQASDGDVKELENPDKLSLILEQLPRQFRTCEYMDAAARSEINERTARRLLKKAIGLKIKRISQGVYEITA